MALRHIDSSEKRVSTISDLAKLANYSFMDCLVPDPDANALGDDHRPRQVFSGHYVPVKPTPLNEPEYVAHSKTLFKQLGFDDELAHSAEFAQLFSGDLSTLPAPMRPVGWATGYALSIYGTEYKQQCPFQTGNGYGDGRAISVFEGVINNQRWEMQLKGSGPTPYCRGADGRAALRSSVREFIAQEHMHALGIPTSRSLSLFVSKTDRVDRPWYFDGSQSIDPEVMVSNPVAISTRVAPSFLRVGQLELFARRVRDNAHPNALKELKMLAEHLLEREYQSDIPEDFPFDEKLIMLIIAYRTRLIALVADWLRVGFCQGNFNSDNCAAGGFTLDYGPFGFCEHFDPIFQPWTGGGRHFSFFNQPIAAEKNFRTFCSALIPLLTDYPESAAKLKALQNSFSTTMQLELDDMWAAKLGLENFDSELFIQLMKLMVKTSVDYTIFFRELSHIPNDASELSKSFYKAPSEEMYSQWQQWIESWRALINQNGDLKAVANKMKQVNPKYTWREWLVVPAYKQAEQGNYALIQELQEVLTAPYDEQSAEIENKYYQLRPAEFFNAGGVSHYSCSS